MRTFKTPKGTELPILDLRGKDYLEVKWRIVWFREEHHTWGIETEFVQISEKGALAKAVIIDDEGRIVATGHKFEDPKGFPDYIEKAETGAIGRALALIGYGTQFCADELDEGKRLADSPVNRPSILDQPGREDGDQTPRGWRFSFGKYVGKSVEEVYMDPKNGPAALSSYVNYLENMAKKEGKPLSPKAQEVVTHIEQFLGHMENSFMKPIDPEGDMKL